MAVRIWFSAEDVARTCVAGPDPFAETLFSVIPLRSPTATWGAFSPWRERMAPLVGPGLSPFLATFPGRPMLDLASVAGRTPSVPEGVDRLLANPRGVAGEIRYLAEEHRGLPGALHGLVEPERGAHRRLGALIADYHAAAIAPHWPRLRAFLDDERARAGRTLAEGGIAGLFAALPGSGVRWRAPVLEVPTGRADGRPGRDVHLGGRGLLLAPSVFFGPHAVLFQDVEGERPDMLVYPAAPPPGAGADLWATDGDSRRPLARLLGRTRARTLEAIDGVTTTELARRVGCSLPSASEHARCLRDAGLVRSERRGGTVVHEVTPLGRRMLEGGSAGSRLRARPP